MAQNFKITGRWEPQQKSNELLQEEIRKAIREKLTSFTFPCPHCQESINDEHFSKEQRAFGYINEIVRKVLEEQIIPQWNRYRGTIVKELEQQKTYEDFEAVKILKEKVENYEKKIIFLQSPEHIENSLRVKKLEQEKKEIENKHWKTIESLQKELSEKKEQIQNLVLRQKGQAKGQDFEKWFYEELLKVFDGRDNIKNISKGQAGVGKRADFLQEVLTETEPKKVVGRIIYETKNTEKWGSDWIVKLENDMRNYNADFGFIVATCLNDKIIRSVRVVDSRKRIYVSGENNDLFTVVKIMRELLITKHNFRETINSSAKEQKIKNLEEWINNKLPKYVSSLEDELTNQEKEANSIISKVEKIKVSKEKIRKLILDKIILEIKNI